MVDPRNVHGLDGARFLSRACQLRQLVGVFRSDLGVEISLDDQERLLCASERLGRIEGKQALEPRRVGLLAEVRREFPPSRSR